MRRTLVGDSKATRGSVDAYLAAQPGPVRHVLEALRRTIHSTAPEAEESFSYGMPAFRVRGRPLVAFGAASGHCALYPMNPETIDTHRRLLGRFETSKGTIRFTVRQPLPASVVRTLVKARLQDVTASLAPPRRQPVPRRSATSSPGSGTPPDQVRSYFAGLPAGPRKHMQKLRAAIRAAAPGAVESFGYGMPAFKLDGKGLVWYAAWKLHSSLYPISQTTARSLAADLATYATSGKGTIRFPLDEPIPNTLVTRLVAARIAEVRRTAPRTTRRATGARKGRPS